MAKKPKDKTFGFKLLISFISYSCITFYFHLYAFCRTAPDGKVGQSHFHCAVNHLPHTRSLSGATLLWEVGAERLSQIRRTVREVCCAGAVTKLRWEPSDAGDTSERQHGEAGQITVIEAPSGAQTGRSCSESLCSGVEGNWEEQETELWHRQRLWDRWVCEAEGGDHLDGSVIMPTKQLLL